VIGNLSATTNNYLACWSFQPREDGSWRALKAQFAACRFFMLDDFGTEVPMGWLGELVSIRFSPCFRSFRARGRRMAR
jgi:hypothetical protein